jgi:signal transduction histidine kinase
VTGTSAVSWLWRPVRNIRDIGWGDIALATLLSIWAITLIYGVFPGSVKEGGAAAALGVLLMTVPVAWERRAPLAAAAAIAVGAVVNELAIGPLIRCGPCLPAALLIAFFAGTRLDWTRLSAAAALCMVNVGLQAAYDPKLGPGLGFLYIGLPAVALACGAGWLVHERGLAAAALRARNAELRVQREQTAELAVAADRARVASDLNDFVRDRIAVIAEAATIGRDSMAADPALAQDALARVGTSGRETLAQMREVVGNLRAERLTGPQPVLADLDKLLEWATTADARLRVSGSPRTLPAGLELSAYRIVEHLLEALEDAPGARIDVHLAFGDEALELNVSGPASKQPGTAFATAHERVALLGGTMKVATAADRCTALVRLPLSPGYASA